MKNTEQMADVSVDLQNDNPEELVNLGIKAYILRDYNAAVTALSRAIELMVKEHGEKGDPLGKVYLYYGKALLEVSREEAEPLGDAVTRELNSDSEEEETPSENVASSKTKKSEEVGKEEGDKKQENMNGSNETKPDSAESAGDKKTAGDTKAADDEKSADENKSDTNKNGKEEKSEESATTDKPQASSTVDEPSNSGTAAEEKEPEDGGESTAEKADEEPSDLQLAWEILELAKLIFEQRADVGKKELADTLVALGEVSMESENFESAIADIKQGLEIQKQILAPDSRNLAETYYKLAVALSTNNQFDEAIENFNVSLNVLKTRIENLKKNEEDGKEEIKDIEALIPEIEEKIADIKSYKEETANKVASVFTEKKIFSEGSGSAAASSSSADKQANDISHLVKRKRKLEDIVEECGGEAKNPNKK